MAQDLNIYYWDTNIFYESLKGEQVDFLKRQAIHELLDENRQHRNRICTSTITHIEVLPKKLPPQKEDEYWSSFTSMFFFDIEVDRSIILLSREIKNFYYRDREKDGEYRMMSSGDAIHLATAIIHGVTEFHTRDANPRNGNVKLLGLPESSPGGKICGVYDLKILSPAANQGSFQLEGVAPNE